jgi:predicted transcriptional regulator
MSCDYFIEPCKYPAILEFAVTDTIKKAMNRNAMAQYQFDQRKQFVLDLLVKRNMTSSELIEHFNVNWDVFRHTLEYMVQDELISKSKIFCNDKKRWISLFKATGREFTPRTYEQCLTSLSSRRPDSSKKGKYDDLIASNPNRRVYAGKKSLFDTKDNSYFGKGQMSKTNRGIGSTWGMFDAASGFD